MCVTKRNILAFWKHPYVFFFRGLGAKTDTLSLTTLFVEKIWKQKCKYGGYVLEYSRLYNLVWPHELWNLSQSICNKSSGLGHVQRH